MSSTLKKRLPEPVTELIRGAYWRTRTWLDFWSDSRRYSKYAMTAETTWGKLGATHLEAQLTRDYHRVEKALALSKPRRPFGSELQRRLDELLPYAEEVEPTKSYVTAAQRAREALVVWNREGVILEDVAPYRNDHARLDSIHSLFNTRHSVRDFSERPVGDDVLIEAVDLAAMSPSVCNRSPWFVRFYRGPSAKDVLSLQYGNSGFGEAVPVVGVVSVELGYFAGSGERNQAFIEGGIFATSLMWALHGLDLDTCMLNLSQPAPVADRLRQGTGMSDSEVPIMMIAVGYGSDGHRVARSPRRPVSQIVIIEGDG